jgi:2-polyprenyl-3-methyl-5-hydroxy-6-metoxy-1,4-benzoquinol methylase
MGTFMIQGTQQNNLLDKVKAEYGLGDNFIQAYFHRWFETTNISEEKFNQVRNDPLLGMWFLFGLTTNQRGRLVASTIRPHIPKDAKRYLDVGCGYGGFLVAFHETGLDVRGFEYDPALVPLSRANLGDYGIDPEQVQTGNVLDSQFMDQFKKIDVITCYDVIEHVNDAELGLKNMARILNPSGVLLLQIPNKDYVNFINRDGHYNLFGLTLLRHNDARKYYQQMVSGNEYTVGEYYEYGFYEKQLQELGCEVHLLSPLYPRKTVPQTLMGFFKTFPSLIRFWTRENKPSFETKVPVTFLYLRYAVTFLIKGFLSLFSKKERDAFARTYMTDFWLVMAVKN